jgi:hypothetical protein
MGDLIQKFREMRPGENAISICPIQTVVRMSDLVVVQQAHELIIAFFG